MAALALLGLAPVMALVALAIKLDSKGPVLFRQKRYGFNNELIEVFKFRSMFVEQADANAAKLVTKDDPRVTRVGRFIRKTSLDELPQLFNVLRGELSLVGPRPHALQAKAADRLYHDVVDGYFARHKVKPGITGWAQINGWRGETDTPEKIQKRVEHDLYYIDNWSVLLDLYILLKTPVRADQRRERVLRRGTHDRARAFAPPGSSAASSRSATHKLALALVWLTVASGAVVFTEPAPVDVLTMGLVVLLPVIGLVAISRSLIVLLAADADRGCCRRAGGHQCHRPAAGDDPHRRLALSVRRHVHVRGVRGEAPGGAHPPHLQRLCVGGSRGGAAGHRRLLRPRSRAPTSS